MFPNMVIFYGKYLLAPRSTHKLENHPSSAVGDCLFNMFAATRHSWGLFLHLQPEDVPCRGDRGPLITGHLLKFSQDNNEVIKQRVL
jgi:hypothetical protein